MGRLSQVFGSVQRIINKHGMTLLLDALSVILAYYSAMALRFAGGAPLTYFAQFRRYIMPIAGMYCIFNGLFGLYARIWTYASSEETVSIIESVATSTFLVAAIDLLWLDGRPLPLSVVLAGGLFTLGAFAVIRYRVRLIKGFLRRWQSWSTRGSTSDRGRVLIVGAGECGQGLAWRLQNSEEGTQYHIVGFVDDDPQRHGMLVHGIRVLGSRQVIPEITREEHIDLIVIAIHTISDKDFQGILSICQSTAARIKMLPDVFESLESLLDPALLRDIGIKDLVGRELVSLDRPACHDLLLDRVVLVTGAGGTIGAELCRQIVQFEPRQLVMVDNSEAALYELGLELQVGRGPVETPAVLSGLCYVVADVTDRHKMDGVFTEYRPQIVVHAAAYKHVPFMERFPEEAIRVNVGGTLILTQLAAKYGAERFVFISTDKAVEPVCVMGATKRVGEMLVAAVASDGNMIASTVRFGNVLGSRGSVVPTFQSQIEAGGPVTVTHPEATRFFMSIPEAARLILHAASMARGGEVFIPDMGRQIRIADLARKMIRLRGLRVGQDIPIAYTGTRPGERLHEKLVANHEEPLPTSHPRIFFVRESRRADRATLVSEIGDLLSCVEQDLPGTGLKDRLLALVEHADTPHDGPERTVGSAA